MVMVMVMVVAAAVTLVLVAVMETAQVIAMDVQVVVIPLLAAICKLQCLNDE